MTLWMSIFTELKKVKLLLDTSPLTAKIIMNNIILLGKNKKERAFASSVGRPDIYNLIALIRRN